MSEREVVLVEFPDDGPTAPINIALAAQDIIDAARRLIAAQRPEHWRALVAAVEEYGSLENLL